MRRQLCYPMAVLPAMVVSRPTALPTATTGRTVQSTVTVTEVPAPTARYCPTAATRRPTTTCEAISRQRSRSRSDNPAAATRSNNSEYDRDKHKSTSFPTGKHTHPHSHIHTNIPGRNQTGGSLPLPSYFLPLLTMVTTMVTKASSSSFLVSTKIDAVVSIVIIN